MRPWAMILTLAFQGQIVNSRISRVDRPIDMEQKGWVGSWNHCDLDL